MIKADVIGRVAELKQLKDFFQVKCGADHGCSVCLFNNMGNRRTELGDTCGIVIIADTIRNVTQNYQHVNDMTAEAENKKSNTNNLDVGIIF
jgi:hypothetical protein